MKPRTFDSKEDVSDYYAQILASLQSKNKPKEPLDFNYTGPLSYDYRAFYSDSSEEELLRRSPTSYALMLCNKIGHYLKTVHRKELVRMDVEFHVDCFGQAWLHFASNIWTRERNEELKDQDRQFMDFIAERVNVRQSLALSSAREESKSTTVLVPKERKDPEITRTPQVKFR